MDKNDFRFDIPSVREPATMADLEHSKEIHAQKVDLLERAEKGERIDINTLSKEITNDKDFKLKNLENSTSLSRVFFYPH